MDAALSLDRHGPLGRFDAPVEAEYRTWLERRVLPLASALALVSIGAWLVAPLTAHLLSPDSVDLSTIYLVAWGIHIPVLAAGLTIIRRASGRNLFAFGILGIGLTAADSLLLIGPALDMGPVAYVAAWLFYGALAPA